MGEELTQDQTMELVRSQYPELIPILSKPGIQDAVFQAVQNNWTPARLQAALQATEYYRTTGNQDRAWDILTTIDPQTANVQLDIANRRVEALVAQTGITPDAATLANLKQWTAARGWDDSTLRMFFVAYSKKSETGPPTGELATNAAQVHALAAQYGVPLSDEAALDWANKLVAGGVDQNAVKGYMIEQAKSLFPSLTGALDAGVTVRQYADPYAQIAARELNMNPNDFNLSDQKWLTPLQQIDPKTGQRTSMSLDQWQTALRTDPKYNYDTTQNGQSAAAALTTALAQKMGAL